jgi:PAS domain S-box-containing protein
MTSLAHVSPGGDGSRARLSPGPWARATIAAGIAYLTWQYPLRWLVPSNAALELAVFIPFALATALAFFRATRQAATPALRRGFGAYALSSALTALGSTLTLALGRGGADVTYSWPNVPYLLSYVAVIFGTAAFPAVRQGQAGRLRVGLDSAIAVVAAMALAWLAIVRPLSATAQHWAHRAILFAYPIGDLALFALIVPLLLNLRQLQGGQALRIVGGAQLLYLLADLMYQLTFNFERPWLSAFADVTYVVGYSGLIWGAELAAREPASALTMEAADAPPRPARNWLPLGLALVVYALLLWEATREGATAHGVTSIAAIMVTLLILSREALTERLNVRLARDLADARNEARLRSVVGTLRTGVVVLGGDARVMLANDAACQLLGLPPDLLRSWPRGAPAIGVVTEDEEPAHHPLAQAREVLVTGRPVRDRLVGLTTASAADRRWLLVNADARRDPDTGRIAEVICTLQDFTERRAIEERWHQSQRMEAVGQLAGGVAHDFNNLLTAITGYTALLLRSLEGDVRAGDAREVMRAAERATNLTKQLLAYGRRQFLQPEPTDVDAVLREAGPLLRQFVGAGIDLQYDLASARRHALVDRGALEQVLVNLVINARDAMPRGGTVAVGTRHVKPGDPGVPAGVDVPAQGCVVITVKDTGSGMPEHVRARAFEPFFTTKEVGQGTGLGLSSVYGIVRQSRGDAWIESEQGKGTLVSIALPLDTSSPPDTPLQSAGVSAS